MPATTLEEYKVRVYSRLEGNTRLYPADDVRRRINEGLRVTNLFAGWSQGRVAVGLTASGRALYRSPSGMLIPLKIYLEGREIPHSTAGDSGQVNRTWLKARGTAVRSWVPIGLEMFILSPAPVKAGQYLEAWGVTEPALMVNDSDVTELADEFSELVVEYAYMNLVIREPGKVFTDASRGYKPWLKKMNELRRWRAKISPNYFIEKERAA